MVTKADVKREQSLVKGTKR